MWRSVIDKLQHEDVRIITVDLIGFGRSPKPRWAKYSAMFQARSLRYTLARLFVTGKVVIVGHSLGSLVAIEALRRYPYLATSLILCSPPLYRAPDDTALLRPERVLRRLYTTMGQSPKRFLAISSFAVKYKLVNKSFNVTRYNIDHFMNALEAAVINQTAMSDIVKLRLPIEIVHGVLDPVVIASNLYAVAKQNQHIHISEIPAGHEVTGTYEIALGLIINRILGGDVVRQR